MDKSKSPKLTFYALFRHIFEQLQQMSIVSIFGILNRRRHFLTLLIVRCIKNKVSWYCSVPARADAGSAP